MCVTALISSVRGLGFRSWRLASLDRTDLLASEVSGSDACRVMMCWWGEADVCVCVSQILGSGGTHLHAGDFKHRSSAAVRGEYDEHGSARVRTQHHRSALLHFKWF